MEWSQTALLPGEVADVSIYLRWGDVVVDGIFSGELVVIGYDSQTGAELNQTVSVTIDLDSLSPEAPSITVSPNPATTMPVSIAGTAESEATVELFMNDAYVGDTLADLEGEFSWDGLVVGLGDHIIKVRAADWAGNVGEFSVPVI